MFDEIDRAYFERRALEEHRRAAAAADSAAALAHQQLAREYESRVQALTATIHRFNPRMTGTA